MPVEIFQRIDSPAGEGDAAESAATKHYTITGTSNEATVIATILASTPTTHLGLPRLGYSYDPVGEDTWDARIKYGRKEEWSIQFDTGGGSTHISASLDTPGKYYAAGVTAYDTQGAIGITKDAVEGVDIKSPVFSFTITRNIDNADMTAAYLLDLFNLTGRTNDATYQFYVQGLTFTFGPRELLFEGATAGTKNTDDQWQLTYKFSASPSVTGLAVGPITGIDKAGWEYLWVHFTEDTDAGRLIKKPVAVFVEQVYPDGDFNDLQFPAPSP